MRIKTGFFGFVFFNRRFVCYWRWKSNFLTSLFLSYTSSLDLEKEYLCDHCLFYSHPSYSGFRKWGTARRGNKLSLDWILAVICLSLSAYVSVWVSETEKGGLVSGLCIICYRIFCHHFWSSCRKKRKHESRTDRTETCCTTRKRHEIKTLKSLCTDEQNIWIHDIPYNNEQNKYIWIKAVVLAKRCLC